MNKKSRYATLLALVLSATLFVPAVSFAKGAIIGYAGGWQAPPTAAQLDRVTHVMLMEWRPYADGTLQNLYPGQLGVWLTKFVTDAHAKGVKVSMALSGSTTSNFPTVTTDANRGKFVTNIVTFVNQYNLDGVDIDWEAPKGNDEWKQCMSLLEELKAAMPGKRISMAIGADSPAPDRPGGQYNNHFYCPDKTIVQKRIWEAVDAIHLMTYHMHGVTWPVKWETHADVNASIACIDRWAAFGAGQPGFSKEKLVIGCAFYGLETATGGAGVYYKNGGGVGCDTPATLKRKVDHCYDNDYGGVMIWELGYDANISTTPDLLSAIWDATKAKGELTNIKTVMGQTASVQIYPNPATTELHIELASQDPTNYAVYNGVGQIVLQGKLQGSSTINVQSLSTGIYYLKISGEMVKVIIAK